MRKKEEKMMKRSYYLPASLAEEVTRVAVASEILASTLVVNALREYLPKVTTPKGGPIKPKEDL